MNVALIEYFPNHGFEVWITDVIDVGKGMGDVFDSREEALDYANNHKLPIVDLTHVEMPCAEGEELQNFLSQYLYVAPNGEVLGIK